MNNREMSDGKYYKDKTKYPMIFYDERWIQISSFLPDIDDRYWVSDYGRMYSTVLSRCLIPNLNQYGYYVMHLKNKNNGYSSISLDRLVCMAFNGMPENYMSLQVNHKDFCSTNNYYLNLEWSTPYENIHYSLDNERYPVGEGKGAYRFKEKDIIKICELMDSGEYNYRKISEKVFGHHCKDYDALYSHIRNGSRWRYISKNYSIKPLSRKRVISESQIHDICKYIESNPKAKSPEVAINALGIDFYSLNDKEKAKYQRLIQTIKTKKFHLDISSQYNF